MDYAALVRELFGAAQAERGGYGPGGIVPKRNPGRQGLQVNRAKKADKAMSPLESDSLFALAEVLDIGLADAEYLIDQRKQGKHPMYPLDAYAGSWHPKES